MPTRRRLSVYSNARPFLMNTIRQEMRRTAERLATQMAYTHTVYMVKGLTGMLALDQADKEWRKQMGYIEQIRQKMWSHADIQP